MIKAILFDLNGTMIDDMQYHAKAWYHIIHHELKSELSFEEVSKEMYGKNAEVLARVFGKDHFSPQEVERLSIDKEKRYQHEYFDKLKLIDGLDEYLQQAKAQGIKMAIASAAIPFNIDFVIDNLNIRDMFDAIVSADDVRLSKPHPETFLKAAELLGVRTEDCVVFEDVPKGVEAAMNAGMKTVVITTMHTPDEFQAYPNVIAFAKDYTDPIFQQLLTSQPALQETA